MGTARHQFLSFGLSLLNRICSFSVRQMSHFLFTFSIKVLFCLQMKYICIHHAHINTHKFTHTHTHTYRDTHTHTEAHTYTHTEHTDTHIGTHYIHIQKLTHICTHTHTQTHTHTHKHMSISTTEPICCFAFLFLIILYKQS